MIPNLKTTPMSYVPIKFPIWNGGQRYVGIADFRIRQHNKIEILYVRKDGTRSFPNCYYISGADIKKPEHKVKTVKGGVKVYLIPISELEEIIPNETIYTDGEERGTP